MLLNLLGGVGLLLFGVNLMSTGLREVAGDRLRRAIRAACSNSWFGLLTGSVVTALIHSSSAMSAIVVGLVNSRLMTLQQAVGVIMGVNIGTTVTAQMIAFRPENLALPAVGFGTVLHLLARERPAGYVGQALLGFGLLFLGLEAMDASVQPLRDLPSFGRAMVLLSGEPLLGVVAGIVMTVVLQSSTATIGMLQSLAAQGFVPLKAAIPIILGDNIGTTTDALIVSIGASLDARRAAILHTLFNVIGTLLFLGLLPLAVRVIALTSTDISRQIANAHTLFNVVSALVMLPFSKYLVGVACWLAPDRER
jgi:phosphate:Na+ symporter